MSVGDMFVGEDDSYMEDEAVELKHISDRPEWSDVMPEPLLEPQVLSPMWM